MGSFASLLVFFRGQIIPSLVLPNIIHFEKDREYNCAAHEAQASFVSSGVEWSVIVSIDLTTDGTADVTNHDIDSNTDTALGMATEIGREIGKHRRDT